MSPMLWGDFVTDYPWVEDMLEKRWYSGFRLGLVLGNIGGAVMATVLWWWAA